MQDCMCAQSLWACPTLCNPMDSSPPGSSVHGIATPPSRHLPYLGIDPMFPVSPMLVSGFCVTSHLGSPHARLLLLLIQSCPTLCDPIDGSPPDYPVPGILQARTLEWVAISFSNA